MQAKTVHKLSLALFLLTLLFGGLTMFIYFGVIGHVNTLLPKQQVAEVVSHCQDLLAHCQTMAPNSVSQGFCMTRVQACHGVHAFIPTITYSVQRVFVSGPFTPYAIASLIFFVIALGAGYLKSGKWQLKCTLRPWHFIMLFLLLMTTLFSTIVSQGTDEQKVTNMLEPTAAMMPNASPSTLAAMQKNYNDLKERDCIRVLGRVQITGGTTEGGVLRQECVAASYTSKVLSMFVLILLLFFEFLILGRFILRKILKLPVEQPLLEMLMSLGLGIGGLIILLWLLAVLHLYVMLAGLIVLLLIPVVGYQDAKYWLRASYQQYVDIEIPWYNVLTILLWLLLTLLVFNFLTVIRPFPIGWDDLGVYLNYPRQLVSAGEFIPRMSSFKWEYISSLGWLLFGFNSYTSATLAMVINWSAGLLAVLAIYTIVRLFVGKRAGLLSALTYYLLPMTGHYAFADMKVDNAIFAFSALGLLALFWGVFKAENNKHKWYLLAGLLLGIAFAMKPTAVLLIMGLGSFVIGYHTNWLGFIGGAILSFVVLIGQGTLDLTYVANKTAIAMPSTLTAIIILATIGTALTAYAFLATRDQLRTLGRTLGWFLLGIFITVAPWIIHNNIVSKTFDPIRLSAKSNNIVFNLDGKHTGNKNSVVKTLPNNLQIDPNNIACTAPGGSEDLERYWGSHTGIKHYLTLPWRIVMNSDHSGYYVTTTFLLLFFPLLLLLPYFWRKQSSWLRWLWAITALAIIQWVMVAYGIPWYGIVMFVGLIVSVEVLLVKSPDYLNKTMMILFTIVALIVMWNLRLWQFESQRAMLEYPMGKVSAEALEERTIPHYDDITNRVTRLIASNPDRPYLYRIGTFIPYFIPNNSAVIGKDDQSLDFFNCLLQDNDPQKTLQRLQAFGFNSIVFDTNTHTIEKDQNGPLHQKVKRFLTWAANPTLGLDIVISDKGRGVLYIELP